MDGLEQTAGVEQPAIPAADAYAAPVDPSAAIPPEGQTEAPQSEYQYELETGERFRTADELAAAKVEATRMIQQQRQQIEMLTQIAQRGLQPQAPPQAPVDPYAAKEQEIRNTLLEQYGADANVEPLVKVQMGIYRDTMGAVQQTFKQQQALSEYQTACAQHPELNMDANPLSRQVYEQHAPRSVQEHLAWLTFYMSQPVQTAPQQPHFASPLPQAILGQQRQQQFTSLRQPVSTGAPPRPAPAPVGPPQEHVERYIASRLERDPRATPEQQKQWADGYRQRWAQSPYNNGQQVTR